MSRYCLIDSKNNSVTGFALNVPGCNELLPAFSGPALHNRTRDQISGDVH